ncbi:hypothetical protein ACX27_26820 [Nostoc piscinale CENA21]|uniref:Uncharacterized protein n=1 Tax=Nostoc piscinale CENA21 TaxID=224013 RepID=A0A0M5MHY1_9NOSO|nr:hypothetical protein [Nostoc piscinale]ALF55642.1 hypothetical protein ACX27_26820 [Nostoc piscinale CENA21]
MNLSKLFDEEFMDAVDAAGPDGYDSEIMQEYRELCKQALEVVEKHFDFESLPDEPALCFVTKEDGKILYIAPTRCPRDLKNRIHLYKCILDGATRISWLLKDKVPLMNKVVSMGLY